MKRRRPHLRATLRHLFALVAAAIGAGAMAAAPQPVKVQAASASSVFDGNAAIRAIDGVIDNNSRWTSEPGTHAFLELDLGVETALGGMHLYNGLDPDPSLLRFKVQFWKDGKWVDIPSAVFNDNRIADLAIAFDDTVDVTTRRLRIDISGTGDGYARVREVLVWPRSADGIPPLSASRGPAIAPIYINQSGFNAGAPKRFTAPTLADGTAFFVTDAGGRAALFSGIIRQHIGDFSDFEPKGEREYVVHAAGIDSVPFGIGMWWFERVNYQGSIDFMIDSRQYVGNVRVGAPGSFGWRDDHHFSLELPALVPQWLSNPSAYTRMPHQVRYEAPTGDKHLWGALQPYRDDAPDIVKLIHWGADVIVTQQATHEMLKAQLAYFLYAWPWLKQYLPQQNYDVVHDFAVKTWAQDHADQVYLYDESNGHDLLTLKTRIGSTKGAYPPGFSVEPNLLMYEVALREHDADAERYFNAAYRQAAWMVSHLDWNDPLVTKGQRAGEWVTVMGLAHFLREYPDRAPAGLAAKIRAWADVALRRSNNMWDFRKLGDEDAAWTPTGEKPTMWNEPGNVVGLPGVLLAAIPYAAPASRRRLRELAYAHLDNSFGRNPVGRHFSFDAPREVQGVEYGWFSYLPGGAGQLADARFVLDGSPKNRLYPYHPEVGNIGWTEGWIQHNIALNRTLASMATVSSHLKAHVAGNWLMVELTAPLNFDSNRTETATVVVSSAGGDSELLTLRETGPNARTFTGRIVLKSTTASSAGNQVLEVLAGRLIKVEYGGGYAGQHVSVRR